MGHPFPLLKVAYCFQWEARSLCPCSQGGPIPDVSNSLQFPRGTGSLCPQIQIVSGGGGGGGSIRLRQLFLGVSQGKTCSLSPHLHIVSQGKICSLSPHLHIVSQGKICSLSPHLHIVSQGKICSLSPHLHIVSQGKICSLSPHLHIVSQGKTWSMRLQFPTRKNMIPPPPPTHPLSSEQILGFCIPSVLLFPMRDLFPMSPVFRGKRIPSVSNFLVPQGIPDPIPEVL